MTRVQFLVGMPRFLKEELLMYIDVRNNNKVIIEKEVNSTTVIVKNLKNGVRYLVNKEHLKKC